ncbi:hypothetical protein BDZ94DRAFT_1272029 [Collybia nuda]|uniref:Uncharacterized protein n=1 Tax=Collybia nuda TaxID=64659 RepID=A0A9P5XUM7_9AGAR|nr:hypothetical protein BDZ94DRAFT_1272029 [Collybia nuda]
MAGSWPTKLHNILRPAWDCPHDDVQNPKTARHAPGATWKKLLGKSVFLDLAGESYERRRRFVRLETLGLSGIIFYEISTGYLKDGLNVLDEAPEETIPVTRLTRKSVFGDPHISSDLGMGIDRLIDVVGAKVLYFPAYACTSFTSGQAMSAFLHDQPSLLPLPASEGFSVNAETLPPPCILPGENPVNNSILSTLRARSAPTFTLPQISPSLAASGGPFLDPGLVDSDSDEEYDISILTIGSNGICTPPRILSGSRSAQAVNSPFGFGFDEETELGYVLYEAMNFFDDPASPNIVSTQVAKIGLPKTLRSDEKENVTPRVAT